MELHAYGMSDKGKRRPHNEDSILVDSDLQLFAVADGMGGHAAGEVASSAAVEILKQELNSQITLIKSYRDNSSQEIRDQILKTTEEAIQKACAAIFKEGQEDQKRRGMGTTLTLMLISGQGAFISHVGDSRVYLMREGQVHQLTIDHTLVNEQLKRGVISKNEARRASYKNVITRALGIQESVRVDTLHLDILPADRFLICSDGLHGYLRAGDVESVVQTAAAKDVPKTFVNLANERGGRDNISLIYIDVAVDERGAAEDLRRRMEIMRNAPLFRYLNYRELVTLMNLTYIKTSKDGDVIIEEGMAGDELFLLVKGEVRVLKGRQEIARLPEGSHFGEMALIDNAPRSASIVAQGPARLLVIGRKHFYDYIRRDAPAGIKLLWSFLQILTLRLRTTDERLREAKEGQSTPIPQMAPDWIKEDN